MRRKTLVPDIIRALNNYSQSKIYGLLLAGLLSAEFSGIAASGSPDKIEFNRDIRPILSQNCFACHGADSASRKAGLRLDHFEDATAPRKDVSPAIVPGKPDASEMMRRILTTDEDDLMPPPDSHKILTAEQKDLLKRWIADGAKYQAHWALLAPERSTLPKVKNKKWVKNPIDNFVLARLEQEKLKPAPEADRRTLARRVSLDLTGFRRRPRKSKHSSTINRPMPTNNSSTANWLRRNGASIAAATGSTPPATPTRTAFTSTTIARCGRTAIGSSKRSTATCRSTSSRSSTWPATCCRSRRSTSKSRSGFNRCNITTSEGGAIDEEYHVLYARDRTETTSQVWLGLTAGCAVCHDHKFDPLSQKEFYELSAFFNNTTQKAMDGNIKDTPPVVVVPNRTDRPRWEASCLTTRKWRKRKSKVGANCAATISTVWLANATAGIFRDGYAEVDLRILLRRFDDGRQSALPTSR